MGENIIAHDIDSTRTQDVLIKENVTFQSMFLSQRTSEGLSKSGFKKPSPIQLKAIPLGRCGFDLIIKSKSGTGKTLVFSVVALEMIDLSSLDLQVLILAPTREIAVQIADTIRAIGISFPGINVNSFIGGLPEKDDKDRACNCQIAVGAPGRIKSLIKQNILNVTSVKLFVLDEADKLLEESFQDDVNEIYQSLPHKKQIITASATYPDHLKDFLSGYMHSPTYVSAENDTQLLLGLKHFIREVKPSFNSAQEMKHKNVELLKLLASISFTQCIIFSNYQTRAENISISINRQGWNSIFISAAQTQEKRLEAIDKLKNFKCRILLSTDLTARGIDASNIDLVINYDVPLDVSTYLHRMGRAGRYGSKGICVTLISGQKDLLQIRKFLGYIGGIKLTISKLTNIENDINNLSTSDESKMEKISGIIEENQDVTDRIKNEILSLKRSSIIPNESSVQTEKKNSICHKDDYKNIKNYSNINTNSNNTNLLGTNEKTDSRTKNIIENESIKNQECQMTDEQTNFHKNDDSIEDVANNTCLLSLANGTFDFDNIPSPKKFSGDNNEFPIGNDTIVEAITEIENQFMRSSSLENQLQNSAHISTSESIDGSDSGNIAGVGCKKKNEKTRKSSELEIENEGKICKNEVYIKNKGIYEVARILNSHVKPDSDAELNLSNYLNILENHTNNNELEGNDSEETNNKCILQQDSVVENNHSVSNVFSHAYQHILENQNNHWKDILKDNDREPVNQNIQENEERDIGADHMEVDYEDHMDEDYEDDWEEGSEAEVSDECSDIEYDENGYINIPNRMVWIPVEESTSENIRKSSPINLLESTENTCDNVLNKEIITPPFAIAGCSQNEFFVPPLEDHQFAANIYHNNHFSNCFQEYSNVLWQDGLQFKSAVEFDRWYYNEWLVETEKIREYVRQNVYVKEMSQYQNTTRKF